MPQTSVNIRMDKDLKESAEVLFEKLGMNMTTALNIFVRQAVRTGGIPFEVTTRDDDFYNEYNQQHLRKAIADNRSFVVKTIDELDRMAADE